MVAEEMLFAIDGSVIKFIKRLFSNVLIYFIEPDIIKNAF